MTMVRVLEIAQGSAPSNHEARELADEILRLREVLHVCNVSADRIKREVTNAKPEKTIGKW
jgi:hypothetical protein